MYALRLKMVKTRIKGTLKQFNNQFLRGTSKIDIEILIIFVCKTLEISSLILGFCLSFLSIRFNLKSNSFSDLMG